MAHSERLLLGPGPSNPYPEVIEALTRPVLGHLDPEFLALLDETCEWLREAFKTTNPLTLPISGTGSAGMEACFVNLVEPGDTVIVGVNGVFGGRMCDVAQRCGAEVVRIDEPWGRTIDPQRLLDAHREHPHARLLAVVHAETSTGVVNEIAPLRALQQTDTLLLVDTVTSLGGIPVEIDAWGVDAVYSGTQKCLGVPPGLAPLSFSPRARRARARPHEPVAVVVPRPRAHRRVRRQRAPLPPHRADLDDLRAPRRPGCVARGRPRSVVGAARARRRRAPGRTARARLPPVRAGRPSPPRAHRPRGCPTVPTTPSCARSCATSTTSRSAAGSASSRARVGASDSWATARGERSVVSLLGALRVLLPA